VNSITRLLIIYSGDLFVLIKHLIKPDGSPNQKAF